MNIFRDFRVVISVRYSIMYIDISESSSVCCSISFLIASYATMARDPAKLNELPSSEYGLYTINSFFNQRISTVLLLNRFEDWFGIAKNYKPASLSWWDSDMFQCPFDGFNLRCKYTGTIKNSCRGNAKLGEYSIRGLVLFFRAICIEMDMTLIFDINNPPELRFKDLFPSRIFIEFANLIDWF